MQAPLAPIWKDIFQNRRMETKAPGRTASETGSARKLLGKRLKAARLKAGLTQPQAGDRLDCSHSSVGQWERGETQVESVNLILAAQEYRASLDWLVFGMSGTLEKRIAALPDTLREGVLEQVTALIENSERIWRKTPGLWDNGHVPDSDPRLTVWSAADKIRQGRKAAKPKPKKKRK
jgi:transcriptional regulator with XRE-family HTH domain